MFLQLKMGCEGSTTEEPASSRLAQGFGEKTPVTGKQGESQMKGIDHARIQETVCIIGQHMLSFVFGNPH